MNHDDLRRSVFDFKLRTARRGVRHLHDRLMQNQRLPARTLATMEERAARSIAAFAFSRSPFYRDLYTNQGLTESDLLESVGWQRLPVVDREMIKDAGEALYTSEATGKNVRKALTGGSTGQPLRTLHDARVPAIASSWRMYSWWGVQPYDNLARIGRWGFGRRESITNAMSWWPTQQSYLDAALITESSMSNFHAHIVKTRPRLLEGYVGAMLEFASFVEDRGLRLPALQAVATTAAPLTEGVRTRLQDVFGVPVYDEYRGSEAGWMAGECGEQKGLHVFSDMRRIEVLSPSGEPLPAGELGDLVLTDLTNRVFPLVRYRLGDRGALLADACPCGVNLPLMAKPDGRTTDMIRLPNGDVLAHRLMAMFSEHPDSIKIFQVHQLADYSITVKVVLSDTAGAQTAAERAVGVLRERIKNAVPVRLEIVNQLPYTGAKTKYIISDVG